MVEPKTRWMLLYDVQLQTIENTKGRRDSFFIWTAWECVSNREVSWLLIWVFSYGFSLSKNLYDTLQIRVVVGTSPDGKIESPADLFPSTKILEDTKNLETTTEILRLRPNKISNGKCKRKLNILDLMNYLRSVLQPNFLDDEDHSFLMVSCPRVPGFELLVVDFALRLLQAFGS